MLVSYQAATLSLLFASALTLVAAFAHFACVPIGAPAFRFLGAGEPIASMAERGHWYPTFVAIAIGTVLSSWAAYALAGAGKLPALPFTKWALAVIAAVFLLRAILFPLLKPVFPGNSQLFWYVTSGICLVLGSAYLVGAIGMWRRL